MMKNDMNKLMTSSVYFEEKSDQSISATNPSGSKFKVILLYKHKTGEIILVRDMGINLVKDMNCTETTILASKGKKLPVFKVKGETHITLNLN